jgi:hypothetical protein
MCEVNGKSNTKTEPSSEPMLAGFGFPARFGFGSGSGSEIGPAGLQYGPRSGQGQDSVNLHRLRPNQEPNPASQKGFFYRVTPKVRYGLVLGLYRVLGFKV